MALCHVESILRQCNIGSRHVIAPCFSSVSPALMSISMAKAPVRCAAKGTLITLHSSVTMLLCGTEGCRKNQEDDGRDGEDNSGSKVLCSIGKNSCNSSKECYGNGGNNHGGDINGGGRHNNSGGYEDDWAGDDNLGIFLSDVYQEGASQATAAM
jgi:hypothetical protein